jgi:tRNA-binding protein
MKEIEYEAFLKVDIRVGEIIGASLNAKAKKKAFVLEIDFGEVLGTKMSSAQITDHYSLDTLIGKQICAVVNFPPKNIAGVLSEVLVLGAVEKSGAVVLLEPGLWVANGTKVL